jgi:hypothetical protein
MTLSNGDGADPESGGGLAGWWRRLSRHDRRYLIGGASAVALILVVVIVIVSVSGGGSSPTTGALPTPSATAPNSPGAVSGKPAVPDKGAYLGAFLGPQTGITDRLTTIAELESAIGKKVAIEHRYYHWSDNFPSAADRATAAQGRIPFDAVKLVASDKTTFTQIASGGQDDVIKRDAQLAKAFGKPMFVSFQHEPGVIVASGDYGTPQDFVAAWRHIVDVYREVGATNVAFVYVQTAYSYRDANINAPAGPDKLYPGDAYIDWLGVDGYSYEFCSAERHQNASWQGFSKIFANFYAWAKPRHKPEMVAEYGVNEDPSNPDRKGDWYRQMASQLQDMPDIKAVVVFDSNPKGGCVNSVSSSSQALAGFKELAQSPYLIGG